MPLANGTFFLYSVRPNDTLYSVADMLDSNVQQMQQLNALFPPITDQGTIYVNQTLIAPFKGNEMNQVFYVVNPGDTLNRIATTFSTSVQDLLALNPHISDPNNIDVNEPIRVPVSIYIVSQGDSLQKISSRFNVRMSHLARLNQNRPGFSLDFLIPGYAIIIPD
ncbi:LysM peptidoglycan-binding domain-containing protein [Salirhabdus salicampi]|uniref:LysM peptidoglycan-binding domain-containing protein n=1 Tax=Salirhabdus salicampi TaxID=476102 RepID=UPI0020C59677|nr:LysM peptidoglycan-binding domain-containing protein [Salirhabdus salicampi]MCP8617900.1 LysM peptidoglycan-binding domain-containing protein [Salirhabdus salicampi]